MTAILFIIILAVLVLIHEFGHFAAAKQAGIRVDEFGLGFPPKMFGIKKGETEYTINWIPFGGFVKIFGETPDEDALTGPDSSRSLINKSKWKQIVVISAGVTMNFFFAWLLFAISFMSGFPASVSSDLGVIENPRTTITHVVDGLSADYAGLRPGDIIAELRTAQGVFTNPHIDDVRGIITATNGQDFTIVFERAGELQEQSINAGTVPGSEGLVIGIVMDEIGSLHLPPHEAIWVAGKFTFSLAGEIAVGLVNFVKDIFIGQADYSQVSGPVGIAELVGDARGFGFIYLLSFTAFISLHLAVLNLLPFPALDGGRLLFIIIEAVRRKAISPKVANTVNAVGFLLLLGLMLLVTVKDVIRLF